MPKQINYQLSKSELEAVEIAQKSGIEPQSRQRATGIRLLHLGKKPVEVAQKLEAAMATDPTELGYGFTLWTIDRLLTHLQQETGITMSDKAFRVVLERNNYCYRRPKHDLRPLQDTTAKQSAEELLDALKKRPQSAKFNYSLWTKRP